MDSPFSGNNLKALFRLIGGGGFEIITGCSENGLADDNGNNLCIKTLIQPDGDMFTYIDPQTCHEKIVRVHFLKIEKFLRAMENLRKMLHFFLIGGKISGVLIISLCCGGFFTDFIKTQLTLLISGIFLGIISFFFHSILTFFLRYYFKRLGF